MSPRILFVYTSADKSPSGSPTGGGFRKLLILTTFFVAFILHRKAEIDFASPKGPNPPVDASSVKASTDDDSVKFLQDPEVKEKLANAKKLADVDPKEYDAVFYIGGHGPMFDLASDPDNTKLANTFFQSGKVTAAVCHGPGALVTVTDASGKSIFAGRNVTGLSNTEEDIIGGTKLVPFSLEDRIKELGGQYTKAEPFGNKVVVDGNVITGQNPTSSLAVGEAIWKGLN